MPKRPRTTDSVDSMATTSSGKWSLGRLTKLPTFSTQHEKANYTPRSSMIQNDSHHNHNYSISSDSSTRPSSSDHSVASSPSYSHQTHSRTFTSEFHPSKSIKSPTLRAKGMVNGLQSFVAGRLQRSTVPVEKVKQIGVSDDRSSSIARNIYVDTNQLKSGEDMMTPHQDWSSSLQHSEEDGFPTSMMAGQMEGVEEGSSRSRPGSVSMSEPGSDRFVSVNLSSPEAQMAACSDKKMSSSPSPLLMNNQRPAITSEIMLASPSTKDWINSPRQAISPLSTSSHFSPSLEELEVLQTLGTGTFGRVLLVREKKKSIDDRSAYFAMKVLKKSQVVRLKQVEHVNSERKVLLKTNHPFVVKLYTTFQDSLNCYMLMEYVVGGEIFSHLRRAKKFSVDVTRFYIATLVLAIAHLHSKRIIYRDLKPENLLIDDEGYIKITDFGFSKELDHTDRTWTLCGTPEYLSPEVIQSRGQSFASDYWALGILMYEMLCGHPPFFDNTPFGTYEKILKAEIYFPKHVDAQSRDLIQSLLVVDVSKRLGNLRGGARDVMEHAWFRGVDWEMLLEKRLRAPIVPVQRHASDSSNFETYDHFHISNMPAIAIGMQADRPSQESDPWKHLFTGF